MVPVVVREYNWEERGARVKGGKGKEGREIGKEKKHKECGITNKLLLQ